eukprot:g10974.t1
MLCRLATTASRRATASATTSATIPRQQALLSTSLLVVCGRPSSSTTAAGVVSFRSHTHTAATAAAATTTAACNGAEPALKGARRLSSSPSAAAAEPSSRSSRSSNAPKLVFGIPKADDVVRTPPMEEEDSGPVIREMRVQLRPPNERGSRGANSVRRAGKVPGILYSNNDLGAKNTDTFMVKVDKIVLDREIRRLGASFDNTVYDLVIEGAQPEGHDDDEGVSIAVRDPAGAKGKAGQGQEEEGGAQQGVGEERRELVLANQTRLHPVLRTLVSVNWIRYKAGRRYPIPIKFINSDLNNNFRKGAYIRRLKTHQHIILPEDPEKVPKWLYLDLEFVRSGSKLRVSDIMMPEGIRLHRGDETATWNEVVCTIKGRKVFASEDDSAGAAEVDDEV